MRKIVWLWMLMLVASPAAAAPMADEITTISVIADSSLALPITRIIHDYSSDKRQAVVASYVPVNQQEEAVTEGVGYDVLITARPKLLELLKQQGVVDIYTESMVAKNRLVLVASKTSDFQASLSQVFPLAQMITRFSWQPGLIVGSPETLLQGSSARQALRYFGVIEDLEPYTIYEKDLSEMVKMIQTQGTLGLLYESDTKNYQEIKIIDRVPENAHDPIVYVAVVLAGDRMEPAREFVEYLGRGRVQQTFEQYGFRRP